MWLVCVCGSNLCALEAAVTRVVVWYCIYNVIGGAIGLSGNYSSASVNVKVTALQVTSGAAYYNFWVYGVSSKLTNIGNAWPRSMGIPRLGQVGLLSVL